jgi:hypothetical protein
LTKLYASSSHYSVSRSPLNWDTLQFASFPSLLISTTGIGDQFPTASRT